MYVILLTRNQIETTTILRFAFSLYNLNNFNNTSIPHLLEYWYSASRSERSSNIQKISQSLTNLYQLLIHNLCIFEEEEDDDDKEDETSSKNINTNSKAKFRTRTEDDNMELEHLTNILTSLSWQWGKWSFTCSK